MASVIETVRSVATTLGLVEPIVDAKVGQFRACRRLIDQLPGLLEQQKGIGEKLTAARAALASGAVEFEGRAVAFKISELQAAHQRISDQVGHARRAEVEAVGCCPDERLQAERRKNDEARMTTRRRIADLRTRIDEIGREIERLEQATTADIGRKDQEQAARRLAGEQAEREFLRGNLEQAERELAKLEGERERIRVAMQQLDV